MPAWIFGLIFLAFCITAFWLGYKIIGMVVSLMWTLIAGVCLLTIVVYAFLARTPDINYSVIPWWFGTFYDAFAFVPPAVIFFAIAARKAPTKILRIEMVLIAALMLLYGYYRADWMLMGNRIDDTQFKVDENGVCRQSTGWSCAPASSVTVLKHNGVTATEREMAGLAHTSSVFGTDFASLARAVDSKLDGTSMRAELKRLDYAGLVAAPKPCAVNVTYTYFMDHSIAIMAADARGVTIGNPLMGMYTMTKDEFIEVWRGYALYVVK